MIEALLTAWMLAGFFIARMCSLNHLEDDE